MLHALLLIAQEGQEAAKSAPGEWWQNPVTPMIVMMVAFYFLMILPMQRKQKREREQIMANLKKNDEVVTSSGIIGIVSQIKEGADEVTLKIDDSARLRVLKSSIVRIIKKEEAKDSAASASANSNAKPT
jgi:preprotein translocase subunit YajC